jgi:RalBP1-associated Eps domain-containing protein
LFVNFRVFFEKSRIPVEELRHIWQLCDVTRDGALDVAEFTAAMHLVVLRRNNIPIPSNLPSCLQPHVLCKILGLPQKDVEADLLQLESDDNQDNNCNHMTQRANIVNKNEYQRMVSSVYDDYRTLPSGKPTAVNIKSSTLPKNHFSSHRGEGDGSVAPNNLNLNLHNNNNKLMSKNVITSSVNRSGSNSPLQAASTTTTTTDGTTEAVNANKEWTKFTESPTSNVSSPGPKPVNVTQAIVGDPSHVIHPVALRVTPVSNDLSEEEAAIRTFRKADTLVYESGVMKAQSIKEREESSPKPQFNKKQQPSFGQHQRDSLPNDLRAIQRPHPKKPASKNIGQIPMPPETNQVVTIVGGSTVSVTNKKDVQGMAPPLPPPR